MDEIEYQKLQRSTREYVYRKASLLNVGDVLEDLIRKMRKKGTKDIEPLESIGEGEDDGSWDWWNEED
jgi:hypothetical protein